MKNNNSLIDEAAAKVAAAIENGASEAPNVIINAHSSADEPVSNNLTTNDMESNEMITTKKTISAGQEEQAQATTDASAVDSMNLEAKRQEIRQTLSNGEEVQIAEFHDAGFMFGDMPKTLQRGETKKNVSELMASLIRTKRFYRPIEIVSARTFIEAGLGEVYRLDGTAVKLSDYDVDLIFVRSDGKQRTCAYAKLLSKKGFKGKEREFDVRVKLCNVPIEELPTYIREIQVAAVWDEKTKRQATVATFGAQESGVTLMDKFMNESGMSARGAYKLIYRREGYKKSLYDDSLANGKLHDSFHADTNLLERAKRDYMAFKVAFRSSPEYFKNSAAVDALIEVYTQETQDPNGAVENYLNFLQAMQTSDWNEMATVKTPAEKKTKFLELFNTHKTKLSEDFAYAGVVEESVKAARHVYNESIASAHQKTCKKSKPSNEANYFGGKNQ